MARYEIRIVGDPELYRRQLVEFWRQNLPPYGTEQRFDWLHHCNPSGQPLTALAFVQGSDTIIGCGSMYPWACRLGGAAKVLWFSSHFAVANNHRVFGPAFTIQKTLAATLTDRGEPFAFGYPNRVSAGTLKWAGYRHIGASHHWVRILDAREVIRRRLPVPGLGSLAGWAFKTLDVAGRSWIRRSCRAYSWEIVERCDSRFDDLWLRTCERSPFLLARTSAVLNWRYADVLEVKGQAVTEIVSHTRFFDYEAKYHDTRTEYVLPAKIPQDVYNTALDYAERVFTVIGCSGIARCDFRYDDSKPGAEGLYFLEINTQPAFTAESIAPSQVIYNGTSYNDLCAHLVETALCHGLEQPARASSTAAPAQHKKRA